MKRVVVSGGAGFIGSHLCDYLLGKGYRVVCLDNLITGHRKNIAHLIGNKNFKFIQQDISKEVEVPGAVDYVLNFASPASPVDYLAHPIETLDVGSLGTRRMLDLALVKKAVFLQASTSEVYGDPMVNPQPESYWGNVNPIGVRSVYDESKRFSEALTFAYRRVHGLDIKIARIFNTYGPRMGLNDGRVVPNFIYQALNGRPLSIYGDGSQTRSFCYVSDLIEGIHRLMASKLSEPVNLGNPNEMSVLMFADVILSLTKSSSKKSFQPLPADDPKVRRPDITKAKKYLHWEPKVGLEEGLKITIKYFKKHPELGK
jgi:dTDP-glucose 4,6-dehydratase